MIYFFSILFGTFILEDVTLVTAMGLVSDGQMSFEQAFLACFLGISIGDVGLYAIGYSISKFQLEKRFQILQKISSRLPRDKNASFVFYPVIISRFVPGTRSLTYLTAGFLRYSFLKFTALTIVTVFVWVALAFFVGNSLSSEIKSHWIWTALGLLVFIKLVQFLAPRLSDSWSRKAFRHSWRQLLHFEFWPANFFYLPVIPMYLILAIKHRSLLLPFYANPSLENGGLLGESKWEFLKFLDPHSPATLKAIKIDRQKSFEEVKCLLEQHKFQFPFVLKPDVGQRGFGVRIIRDDSDLATYLGLADFEMIAQNLSRFESEAGVFYIRLPSAPRGFLFSITDKRLPKVIGDGKSSLGDLILQDRRARVIASTYFSRHRNHLNDIPADGSVIPISECGNHCQGAIFVNGKSLIVPELLSAIEKVTSCIPGFYFGRIDLRFQDAESLKRGQNFEIIEVNGAGSEAAHIYDADTRLLEAYRVLFQQWTWLFQVGEEVKNSTALSAQINIKRFLSESVRVFFRKSPLSVSS